jgi:general secretion pathway protein B
MSFILDQLKKSGKKRQLELAMRSKAETRSRETAEASRTDFQPKSDPMINRRVIYLLLFLAAVSFSALGGFLLLRGNPGSQQAPVVSTKAQVYSAGISGPKAESVRPESVLPADGGTSISTNSPSKAGEEEAVPAPAAAINLPDGKVKSSMPIPVAELRNQPESAAQAQIAEPSPEKSEMRDDANSIPYLNELPASLKNALPPIRMTSHLYRGSSRLVSINGRIMSGGVNMGDGLILEEITPEGVIMSFRGQRFRLKAD